MNLLAIVGSPRKGKATDTLVDQAIDGFRSKSKEYRVRKVNLIEYNIQFCRNCLSCRDDHSSVPMAECIIKDDMEALRKEVQDSDTLIFGTPVHMGYAPGIMMTFLERICWTFAKPDRKVMTIEGCPLPRTDKERKAVIIVTSGIVPPIYKKYCNWASDQIKGIVTDSLNGKVIGNLYAGDIEHRGVDFYLNKAFKLGAKLA